MQLGFVIVRGRSMEPTYIDGDVLLVGHGLQPKLGRCHVVRLPDGDDGPRPLSIKRVAHREVVAGEDQWWVERDNPREGIDSWHVGPLPTEAMLARVLTPNSPGFTGILRRCRKWLPSPRRA